MKQCQWLVPLLLTGCVSIQPTIERSLDLCVYPHLAQQTQAVINPLTLSSIATLDIVPYVEVSAGAYAPISSISGNATTVDALDILKLTQASPSIDPNRPFILRRLRPNKNYRIFGQAYGSSNSLISLNSTSYVDVAVGNDDAPAIAQLPVFLKNTPFGATTSVVVNTNGHFEYLRSKLFLNSGNLLVDSAQTVRQSPTLNFANLEVNTNYRLVVEAYKLGNVLASTSLDIAVANDNAVATASLALTIPYVTTTFAGSTKGSLDGNGTQAQFNLPHGVTVDTMGYIWVADEFNNMIRKISPTGLVTTVAGNGSAALLDGTGTNARFYGPYATAFDPSGNLIIVDRFNNCIRKMTPAGVVTTLAGNGTAAFADGNGPDARFNSPLGVAVDTSGNIFVADFGNNRIRKITSANVVSTFAGNGVAAFADGNGTQAAFNQPEGVGIDGLNNLYIGDRANHRIRKITPAGDVSTIVGNGTAAFVDGPVASARLNVPSGVTVDAYGTIFFGDQNNVRVRKLANGVVSTLCGNGATGFSDGTGTSATINYPVGVAVDAWGNVYLGDYVNDRIRKIQ